MKIRRFYSDTVENNIITLDKNQSHHAINVLKLRTGNKIEVFDSSGLSFICELIDTKKIVKARVIKSISNQAATVRTICASAIPKGQKV